jgi:hypothetical protein
MTNDQETSILSNLESELSAYINHNKGTPLLKNLFKLVILFVVAVAMGSNLTKHNDAPTVAVAEEGVSDECIGQARAHKLSAHCRAQLERWGKTLDRKLNDQKWVQDFVDQAEQNHWCPTADGCKLGDYGRSAREALDQLRGVDSDQRAYEQRQTDEDAGAEEENQRDRPCPRVVGPSVPYAQPCK